MRNSDWDLDLRAGEEGESKIADLLSLDTVEVKTDKRWKETGNLYIETDCYYRMGQWKPSGISVSKATHWAFMLEDMALIVPIWKLKEAVYNIGRPIDCDIPPNPSKGYLITPSQIVDYIKASSDKLLQDMAEQEGWSDPAEWEDI